MLKHFCLSDASLSSEGRTQLTPNRIDESVGKDALATGVCSIPTWLRLRWHRIRSTSKQSSASSRTSRGWQTSQWRSRLCISALSKWIWLMSRSQGGRQCLRQRHCDQRDRRQRRCNYQQWATVLCALSSASSTAALWQLMDMATDK